MDKKIAIVTGGSSGMGLAISKKLKQMGMEIVIFDIQNPPDDFPFYHVDIRNDEQIKAAISQIPKIDILVNNAGIYFEKYLEDTTNDEIDKMVDVNIKGTYLITRNAFQKVKECSCAIK